MSCAPVLLVGASILLLASGLMAQAVPAAAAKNPRELGKVAWLRDHDKAVAQSRKAKRPIFLFFQEVPG